LRGWISGWPLSFGVNDMPKTKKTEPKLEKLRVTKDRLPLGDGTTKVRGQSVMVDGKPVDEAAAKQFIENGWCERA